MFGVNILVKIKKIVCISLCLLFVTGYISVADAQCLPGLPCTNPSTPNDPYDGTISPNTSGPHANKTDSNMCDADFMNQIYAKAFLEAERENILNEIVIRKPDSTMEYSCYEQVVSMTAHKAGPLFSESDYWWNRDILIDNGIGDKLPYWRHIDKVPVFVSMCPPDNPTYPTDYDDPTRPPPAKDPCEKLDKSLEDLVLYALYDYVDKNFQHDFLGGYAAGLNNDITGEVVGADYLCDMMYVINIMSRCDDFDTDDKFFSFETLVSFDPRILPDQCPDGTPITEDIIKVAKNEGGTYAYFDQMDSLLNRVRRNVCSDPNNPNDNGAPVPTGVYVVRDNITYNMLGNATNNPDKYEEHICINPGCTYDFQSKKCKPY